MKKAQTGRKRKNKAHTQNTEATVEQVADSVLSSEPDVLISTPFVWKFHQNDGSALSLAKQAFMERRDSSWKLGHNQPLHTFTHSESLQAALLMIPGRPVHIDDLLPFAADSVEHDIMKGIQLYQPGLLAGFKNRVQALWYLRTIAIPLVCHDLIREHARQSDQELFWLGHFASYVIAFQRTVWEKIIHKYPRNQFQAAVCRNWEKNELKVLFDCPQEELICWIRRFDRWRYFVEKSLYHYINQQSIDLRRGQDPILRLAGFIGVMKKLNSLPEKLWSALRSDVFSNPARKAVFQKNAIPSRWKKTADLSEATWLIEIWPIVEAYRWTPRDLFNAYLAKFEPDNPSELKPVNQESSKGRPGNGASDAIKNLKTRCRRLGLNFPAKGKVGPLKDLPADGVSYPVMTVFANGIESIGEDPGIWILGFSAQPIN